MAEINEILLMQFNFRIMRSEMIKTIMEETSFIDLDTIDRTMLINANWNRLMISYFVFSTNIQLTAMSRRFQPTELGLHPRHRTELRARDKEIIDFIIKQLVPMVNNSILTHEDVMYVMISQLFETDNLPNIKDQLTAARAKRHYIASKYYDPNILAHMKGYKNWIGRFSRQCEQFLLWYHNNNALPLWIEPQVKYPG